MATVTEKRTRKKPVAANGAELNPHRFTIAQYERMTEIGVLSEKDHVELLDGWIVDNVDIMTQHPPHMVAICLTRDAITPLLAGEWIVWEQKAIRLSTSEPEPDIALVLGPSRRYSGSPPSPADIGQVIEVADSSIERDRDIKGPIYARARIAHYWIVNLPERKLETYSDPKGGKAAGYRTRRDHGPDELVPLILKGREVGRIRVRDLLP